MNRIKSLGDLVGKFTDLAFDESAEMRWQESRPAEADSRNRRGLNHGLH